MRSFDEINADINRAIAINDAAVLRTLVMEMEALGTAKAAVAVSHTMGVVHALAGDYPPALEHFQRALAMHEELDNLRGMARLSSNMGLVYNNTGDFPQSLEYFRRALMLHEEQGDDEGLADVTGNMGLVYASMGEYTTALEYYQKALSKHEEHGDRAGVAVTTGNIGVVYFNTGDYSSALEHYRRSLAIIEDLGDRTSAANIIGNMIMILLEVDKDDEAATLLDQQAASHMDDPMVRAEHAANRAKLAERTQDLDAAHDYLRQALAIATEAGRRADAAAFHQQLRDLAHKRNDLAGYVEHNAEYHRITEEIRGKNATQKMAMMDAERKMESERRERDKERALLFGTLPESVANRILRGEKVTGDHYENASVIFLDIAGFTSISDKIPPGHVVHLLSQIFSALDEVCKTHSVTKIKTIGDSYMAAALPGNGEQGPGNGAERETVIDAANCALEMLSALDKLAITMPPELGDTSWTKDIDDIQVRIGVHCGPVTAGVIGTARMQYDVWGDTVNVASRMESTGEPGRIQVSESFARALCHDVPGALCLVSRVNLTWHQAPGTRHQALGTRHSPRHPALRERGAIEVKGKGTMKTYWLEDASARG